MITLNPKQIFERVIQAQFADQFEKFVAFLPEFLRFFIHLGTDALYDLSGKR